MVKGQLKYFYITKRNELIIMFTEPIHLNLKINEIYYFVGNVKIRGVLKLYNTSINYIKLVDWQIINLEKGEKEL